MKEEFETEAIAYDSQKSQQQQFTGVYQRPVLKFYFDGSEAIPFVLKSNSNSFDTLVVPCNITIIVTRKS